MRSNETKHRALPGMAGLVSLLIFSLILESAALQADSIRCGRKVVRTGDSPADLERHCGSPQYKDRGQASVRLDKGARKVQVERWYCKKSSRSLERIVMIYRGRIVAMETGSR